MGNGVSWCVWVSVFLVGVMLCLVGSWCVFVDLEGLGVSWWILVFLVGVMLGLGGSWCVLSGIAVSL